MDRIILHVDVNNAFLSWTAVDMLKNGYKKDIRNEIAVIGGDESERRGIVLAKSQSAKKLGIQTAESLYSARKKCSYLKVYSPNYGIYKKYSDLMYKYLCNYSPLIERYSIDECFIDYTGCEKLFGSPIDVAYKIKDDIKEKFGFTVNVGVGNNKLCAKMASDFSKPDKVHTLFNNEIKEKLWPLPISELFMIGKRTSEKLKDLNINTIGDLANTNTNMLVKRFKNSAYHMVEYANGIDNSEIETGRDPKSISSSTVLPFDYVNIDEIKKIIRELTLDIGKRIRKCGFYASVLSLTLQYGNFEKSAKQKKLERGINSDNDLYYESINLFNSIWNKKPLRHIGIAIRDFSTTNNIQMSLNEKEENINENKKLQNAVDNIRNKYGNTTMIYGDMLKNDKNKNT